MTVYGTHKLNAGDRDYRLRGARRQMKVRGGQEEGHRSDTAREKGQRGEVRQ